METYAYKLGEIFENYDYLRKPLSSMERESFQGPYPYYGAQGIIDYVKDYRCDGEYILIAEDGENLMSRKQPIALIAKGKFWVNNHAHIMRTNHLADMLYTCYALNCLDITGFITGAAQPKLSQGNLYKIKMLFPKKKYQEKIALILSVYDDLVEVNNKRIRVLEQMAENLYKEWFVRLRFPEYDKVEYDNGIPKGWEYTTVGCLSKVLLRGISPDYDENGSLMVISQKCIRQNIMDVQEARRQNKVFKKELNILDGDTVICSTGTGTLGRVGQVYGNYPGTTFDSHVTLVRAKKSIGKHFLYWSLKALQDWFMNMGIGSTNQQELYKKTIAKAKVLLPDEKVMRQFEEIIEPIHQSIIQLINRQNNLIKQRDLLLPRLLSGKLEVR